MAHTADMAVPGVPAARLHIVSMDINPQAGASRLDAARTIRVSATCRSFLQLENAQIPEKSVPDEALNDSLAAANRARRGAALTSQSPVRCSRWSGTGRSG
jgi:hypothetical protein